MTTLAVVIMWGTIIGLTVWAVASSVTPNPRPTEYRD